MDEDGVEEEEEEEEEVAIIACQLWVYGAMVAKSGDGGGTDGFFL